jgi:hypothetical protein
VGSAVGLAGVEVVLGEGVACKLGLQADKIRRKIMAIGRIFNLRIIGSSLIS